jgi:serralysin
MFGDAGDDVLEGGEDDDQMFGGDGLDDLFGGDGNDRLSGGAGTDRLTGGLESDSFIFKSVTDSVKGSLRDQILDFSHAEDDTIVLATIDANTHKGGNQAFHFIGAQGFHDKEGELHYLKKAGSLVVEGDVNGDGRADFQIEVHDVTKLFADDFNL